MVLLQLKYPLELFAYRRDFLPGSAFLSRCDITSTVESDVKSLKIHSFFPLRLLRHVLLDNGTGNNTVANYSGPGGGTQVQRGAAPALRISRKKGYFFLNSACPRFCKRREFLCTQVRSMGVKIPLQATKYTRI